MDENVDGDIIVKVVLVGSSMVGKTSIVSRIMKNEFTDQPPTIGVSFITHFIFLSDSKQVRLQIWDTAGDERFKAVTPMYYKECNVAIIVYAINDHKSFDSVKGWISDIISNTEIKPLLFIVGNKIDLETDQQITSDEEKELEKEFPDAIFCRSSAKTNSGIVELFDLVAEKAVQTNHVRNSNQKKINVKKDDDKNDSNSSCC